MNEVKRYRVKAVVFDKDGVLADSESINLLSAYTVFREHGYELGPEDEPAIVGKHPLDYVPVFARRFAIDEDEQRRMIDEQDVIYTKTWEEQGRLFEGARETLAAVRKTGLGMGLATSSSRREVEDFLQRFDLASCFDVTLTLDDVTRSKPDPEMYLAVARELGVAPGDRLVVEDSEHGVRAATDAGAICVAVRSRNVAADRVARAHAHVDSVAEVPRLLQL